MPGEGFLMDSLTAMVFFRYLRRYKVADDDRTTRMEVLRRLTAKKKAKYLRDPQEFIRGKKALFIKGNK